MSIGESVAPAMESREVALQCDACGKRAYGQMPYRPTAEQRLAVIRAAMDEHRRVCSGAPPEAVRKFEIIYQRV